MAMQIFPLNFEPGIQKDGTQFSGRAWLDGVWARFQRGLPQKMGGYTQIASSAEIVRGTFVLPNAPNFNIYYGTASFLRYVPVDQFHVPIGPTVDRTPAPFQADINNDWQFDFFTDAVFDSNNQPVTVIQKIVAFAAPNLSSIDSNVKRPIYWGNAFDNTPLTPTGIEVSGGIAVLGAFLFMFGENIIISNENDPTTILDVKVLNNDKVVAGMATRGGNFSPAGLFWTLSSLIRVTNVSTGPAVQFAFDEVTTESSVLSSRAIIEMDGIYYWPAIDRFLSYNGVVQEIPNDKNINFFFRNINYAQRQKVWATKITQYGEIWFHYPSGTSVECDSALVFNVREKSWYNTPINRSDGYFSQVFDKPVWGDNQLSVHGDYPLWVHEVGYNKVDIDGEVFPILFKIQTPYFSMMAAGVDGQRQGIDRWTELYRFEPDMTQVGDMTFEVIGRKYARSNTDFIFTSTYSDNQEKIDVRKQAREMSFIFTSEAIDGYCEFGQCLAVLRPGDERQ